MCNILVSMYPQDINISPTEKQRVYPEEGKGAFMSRCVLRKDDSVCNVWGMTGGREANLEA